MKLLILILTIEACLAKDTVPVFIMDPSNLLSPTFVSPDPLKKITSKYFATIIQDAIIKSECLLIFMEKNLSSEDISINGINGSPYKFLQDELNNNNLKYLPAVEDPYKTVSQILKPTPVNVLNLAFGDVMFKSPHNYQTYIYVFFKDGPNETRAESLRNHDRIIKEFYTHLRETQKVVAIYSGMKNPVTIKKIEYVVSDKTSNQLSVFVATEMALFQFAGVYASTSKRRSTYIATPTVSEEKISRRQLSTTMAYPDFELQFNFGIGDSRWTLDTVVLLEGGQQVGSVPMGVGAPWNCSYACAEHVNIVNARDGSLITITQYQIQPIYSTVKRRSTWVDETSVDPLNLQFPYESLKANPKNKDPKTTKPKGANPKHTNPKTSDKTPKSNDLRQSDDPEPDPKDPTAFGTTVNCGPFFNTNVLSGLLISYICLGTLVFGVVALVNCGANDRFDDPHGKEVITTQAEEI